MDENDERGFIPQQFSQHAFEEEDDSNFVDSESAPRPRPWIQDSSPHSGTTRSVAGSDKPEGTSGLMTGLVGFAGVVVLVAGLLGLVYSRKRRRGTGNATLPDKKRKEMPKMSPIVTTDSLLRLGQFDMEVGKGSPAFSPGVSDRFSPRRFDTFSPGASVLVIEDDDSYHEQGRLSFESRLMCGSIMTDDEDTVEEVEESQEPAFEVQVVGSGRRVQSGMSGLSEFTQ
jgi:hypothetical protein